MTVWLRTRRCALSLCVGVSFSRSLALVYALLARQRASLCVQSVWHTASVIQGFGSASFKSSAMLPPEIPAMLPPETPVALVALAGAFAVLAFGTSSRTRIVPKRFLPVCA